MTMNGLVVAVLSFAVGETRTSDPFIAATAMSFLTVVSSKPSQPPQAGQHRKINNRVS